MNIELNLNAEDTEMVTRERKKMPENTTEKFRL
jgi:hypothetical protein